jgi:hypothetical protein
MTESKVNLFGNTYTIKTCIDNIHGSIITQTLTDELNETTMRWIIDTREKAIKDALIQLGWTPPQDKE